MRTLFAAHPPCHSPFGCKNPVLGKGVAPCAHGKQGGVNGGLVKSGRSAVRQTGEGCASVVLHTPPPVWVLRLRARERACRGWGVPAQSVCMSYSRVSGAEGQKGGVPFRTPCANRSGLVRVHWRVLFSMRVGAEGRGGDGGDPFFCAPSANGGVAARPVPAPCSHMSGVEGGVKGREWGRTFPRPQCKQAGPLCVPFACPVRES